MKKIIGSLLISICINNLHAQLSVKDSLYHLSQKETKDTSRVLLLSDIGFEFVNLYIHPFLSHITNDSPLLMLLVIVCIAALLVPSHYRLEKLVILRLYGKNKKMRLAAAKKVIAKPEDKATS